MSKTKNKDTLQCTLDRWENGRAILRFNDDQELVVPRRFIPKNCDEGQIFIVSFLTEEMATKHKQEQVRLLLKEILRP